MTRQKADFDGLANYLTEVLDSIHKLDLQWRCCEGLSDVSLQPEIRRDGLQGPGAGLYQAGRGDGGESRQRRCGRVHRSKTVVTGGAQIRNVAVASKVVEHTH